MPKGKAVAFSLPSSRSFPYSVKQNCAVTSQMQWEHRIVIKTQNFIPHQHSPEKRLLHKHCYCRDKKCNSFDFKLRVWILFSPLWITWNCHLEYTAQVLQCCTAPPRVPYSNPKRHIQKQADNSTIIDLPLSVEHMATHWKKCARTLTQRWKPLSIRN